MPGNANSGRRPQPTAVKGLRGNPGKRRLNVNEPTPPDGVVQKPDTLSRVAGVVWEALAPVAMAMGTLTVADTAAFATLCELEATRRQASAQKDADGFGMFTVSQDFNGVDRVGVHAAIKVERETAAALRPYYEKFGLEPSGRARMSVPKRDTASKWERIGLVS